MKNSISIIGDGTVGKALGEVLNVKPLGLSEEKINSRIVIICVPTPTVDFKQDLSAVHQAIGRIESAQLIMIRSTVLPGTTQNLSKQYSKFRFVFIPEYGFEKTMKRDLQNSDIIIGIDFIGDATNDVIISLVLESLPSANKVLMMPTVSAEFAKYFTNIWGCVHIMMANSLYDWVISSGYDIDCYEEASLGAMLHKNVPYWGWKIFDHNGERGYGGKCLPKDIQAALGTFQHELWLEVERENNSLPDSEINESA